MGHDVSEGLGPLGCRTDPLPGREEPPQHFGIDGLHVASQRRQGAAPDHAQHLGIAELRAGPTRTELSTQHPFVGLERRKRQLRRLDRDAEPVGDGRGGERAVGPGVPLHERSQRIHQCAGRDCERLGEPRFHGEAFNFGTEEPKSVLEIVALLRQVDWALPVIVITGFGDLEAHAEAARLGAMLFDKPVDLDVLATAACAALGLGR